MNAQFTNVKSTKAKATTPSQLMPSRQTPTRLNAQMTNGKINDTSDSRLKNPFDEYKAKNWELFLNIDSS